MHTKSQLKTIFGRYNFRPLKRFGENYQIDGNIKDKIIEAANISGDDHILEIGPGLGALTMDLAETGADVVAVEKDPKAFAILKDLAGGKFANLRLVNGDILSFDIENEFGSDRVKIIGNLPYYITTPIIEYLISNKDSAGSALIVIQKEVAARILAGAGSKDYGSLSCFVQYHARCEYLRTIKRTCFYPAPEVDSSLMRLYILKTPPVRVKDEELMFRIIRGAFNQRRKSIINSLSRDEVLGMTKEKLSDLLKGISIDPAARPETLGLEAFANISDAASF